MRPVSVVGVGFATSIPFFVLWAPFFDAGNNAGYVVAPAFLLIAPLAARKNQRRLKSILRVCSIALAAWAIYGLLFGGFLLFPASAVFFWQSLNASTVGDGYRA